MNKIFNAIKQLLKLFVIVYGFTMIATVIFMTIYHRKNISLGFLVNSMLFSFVALLPVLPYFIINIENKTALQHGLIDLGVILFNEGTLMPLGYKIGMWDSLDSGILMALVILAVNIATRLVAYGRDALTSSRINNKLTELQTEQDEEIIIPAE